MKTSNIIILVLVLFNIYLLFSISNKETTTVINNHYTIQKDKILKEYEVKKDSIKNYVMPLPSDTVYKLYSEWLNNR